MFRVSVLASVFVLCLGCKKTHSASDAHLSENPDVPKALYGTWSLSDDDQMRSQLKIEPSKVSHIVYCDHPDHGRTSRVASAPANISASSIEMAQPTLGNAPEWCPSQPLVFSNPIFYKLVNDALHITLDASQGVLVLQRAK